VWLDRGELDKVIERAAAEFAPSAPPATPQPQVLPSGPGYGSQPGYGHGHYKHHKRRKSWLEEIFD
jgi:hypothetical protein